MSRLDPQLSFDGTAREAMEFSADMLGGRLADDAWGDDFGICLDRFATSWMVNINRPEPA